MHPGGDIQMRNKLEMFQIVIEMAMIGRYIINKVACSLFHGMKATTKEAELSQAQGSKLPCLDN